jgi:hypothetical protein
MGNIYREEDEQFEQFLRRAVTRCSETELTEENRKERRARCDSDEFEFCREYYPEIFSGPWNELHHHIKSLESGEHGIGGCRFFGKTTYGIFGKIVKRIALGGIGLIGLALRDEDDAKERTYLIYRKIKKNKKLCYDYHINFQQEKKGFYIINNKSFVSLGMREGLRNWFDDNMKRFELIVCDDLFNRQTVSSEVDNEKVYNFVTSECSGQLNPDGLLLWFFNLITEKSPGSRFVEDRPESCFTLPALNDKDETNWPGSFWTTEQLLLKKAKIPLEVWLGDWMNRPVQIGEFLKTEWQTFVNINTLNIIATIGAMDPSYGKSPSACLKGGVILGLTDKGKSVLLDVYARKEDYCFVFDWFNRCRQLYPAFKAILWEDDFAQWTTAMPYYNDWVKQTGLRLPIIRFLSSSLKTEFYGSDKIGRIMNLVYPYQTANIIINEDIKASPDFKVHNTQYISFGRAKEKLDVLDAEASAFIMLPGYVGNQTIKNLKERKYARSRNSNWLHNR